MRESRTAELREVLNSQEIADNGQYPCLGETGDGVFRFIPRDEVLELRQHGNHAVEVSHDVESWDGVWRTYSNLECDYSAIQRDIFEGGDTLLAEVTVYGDGVRVLRQELLEMLASFVLLQ